MRLINHRDATIPTAKSYLAVAIYDFAHTRKHMDIIEEKKR